MDMEKFFERLTAKMDANQAKAETDREADHKELLARLEDDRQAERRFLKEMMQIMDTSHKEVMAEIEPGRNMETIVCQEMGAHPEEEKPASVDRKPEAAEHQEEVPVQDATAMPVVEPKEETTSIIRKETMFCQEMETRLEEKKPSSPDRKPEAAQKEEVPAENAEEIPVGEPRKKRRRDRNQRKMKKRTQENDGCQRSLAATSRGTSNHAKVAWKTQADRKIPRVQQWDGAKETSSGRPRHAV
jgi:hypothetical protein